MPGPIHLGLDLVEAIGELCGVNRFGFDGFNAVIDQLFQFGKRLGDDFDGIAVVALSVQANCRRVFIFSP